MTVKEEEDNVIVEVKIYGRGYIFSVSLPLEKLNVAQLSYFLLVSEEASRAGLLAEGEEGWSFETPEKGLNYYLIDNIEEGEPEEVEISLNFVNSAVIDIIVNVKDCGGDLEKATRRAIPLLTKLREMISPSQLNI
ncbi:MAG: hypothetical protein QW298_02350 [Candidatus Micrarchaeaceae archaeon]